MYCREQLITWNKKPETIMTWDLTFFTLNVRAIAPGAFVKLHYIKEKNYIVFLDTCFSVSSLLWYVEWRLILLHVRIFQSIPMTLKKSCLGTPAPDHSPHIESWLSEKMYSILVSAHPMSKRIFLIYYSFFELLNFACIDHNLMVHSLTHNFEL